MTKSGRRLSSVVEAIGCTALVELSRMTGACETILAKLEYLNPGGSKTNRIARQILEHAVATGLLARNQPVVEVTSGNTGTGLCTATTAALQLERSSNTARARRAYIGAST
jgi:cysteine synthase